MYTGRLAVSAAKKGYVLGFIALAIVLTASLVFGEVKKSKPVQRRASVRLKHISGNDAIIALKTLNLGNSVTSLPKSPETLVIVSDKSSELDKARLVLNIIDSQRKYSVRTIREVQGDESIPQTKDLAGKLPGFVIGSFEIPPTSVTENPKVLIDVLDSNLIVIAPADSINLVSRAIDEVTAERAASKPGSTSLPTAGKTDPNTAKAAQPDAGADPDQPADDGMAAMLKLIASMSIMEPQPAEPNEVGTKEEKPEVIEQPEPAEPESATQEQAESVKPAATPELSDEELETILKLPQKVEVIKLIELVGKQLKLNYIYDPIKVKGDIMLKIHDGKIKVKDLYTLLENVLKFKGFVMTKRENLVIIRLASDKTNIETAIRMPGDPLVPGEIVVSTMFELEHIDTTSGKNLLESMNLSIRVDSIQASNTIIVTGYAYLLPKIEKILKMVDVPGEPRSFEFRQLNYTLAANLVQKLQKLTEQLDSVTVTIGAAPAPRPPTRTVGGRTVPPRSTPSRSTATQKPTTKKTVYIDVDERTNRILMIGNKTELATVGELIDTLDIPKKDIREIRQYEIENVAAEEVEDTLFQLGIVTRKSSSSSPTRRTSTTSPRPPTSRGTQPPTTSSSASGKEFEDEAQVVVLESTNSLLVNGTPEQHDQIAMIVGFVDSDVDKKQNPYVIYPLENQDPEVMAETLTQVIKGTTKTAASSDPKLKTTTVKYDEEDEVLIVPDINTFSLIVSASRKQQEQIAQLIEILDNRRPQVLIDVTLVEITKDDEFTYDLNLVSSFPDLVNPTGLVGSVTGALTASEIGDLLNTSGQDRLIEVSSAGGTGKAFYGDNHIQALLTLMQTNNYGRVLAQPKVLVNDNEEGSINTEKTIYIAKSSQTSDPTTGDAVAYIQTNTTFQDFTSGINLMIRPNISEGNLLRLEIELKRSQQDSPSKVEANVPPPPRTENNITTIVTVPDKSTIILGGIQQLSQSKNGSKVPFFGDLPLIGGLFRSTSNFDKQTKLYIFVRATILRPDETEVGLPDLIEESNLYKAAFEEAEKDWQEHKSWPGVKPKIVEPEKFLEVR